MEFFTTGKGEEDFHKFTSCRYAALGNNKTKPNTKQSENKPPDHTPRENMKRTLAQMNEGNTCHDGSADSKAAKLTAAQNPLLVDDVLLEIFAFCDAPTLCHSISLVCQQWHKMELMAWKSLYQNTFGTNDLPVGFKRIKANSDNKKTKDGEDDEEKKEKNDDDEENENDDGENESGDDEDDNDDDGDGQGTIQIIADVDDESGEVTKEFPNESSSYKFFYRVKSQYASNLKQKSERKFVKEDFPDEESQNSWFARQVLFSGKFATCDSVAWNSIEEMLGDPEENDDVLDDGTFSLTTLVDQLTKIQFYVYTYEQGGNIAGIVFAGKGVDDAVAVIGDSHMYEYEEEDEDGKEPKHQSDVELRDALQEVLFPISD